ncbi:hypothetical protein RIF29_18259 [Crotalaria pallida]|uniref:Uncharacterized protein n=1 Tax=Crotalaria pallida TaxID=3830 RepID=A0AAN9FIR2_CROPI
MHRSFLPSFLNGKCRKGRFSIAKLKGKHVIELGAGYGVSGFGKKPIHFLLNYGRLSLHGHATIWLSFRNFCEKWNIDNSILRSGMVRMLVA